mmetsp:Transcript_5646/g.10139  ORF Transcript_5646/g.10139 Transcript_5646/m.10139 type:complete len:222 (+) Transcript_5646:2-667(+)
MAWAHLRRWAAPDPRLRVVDAEVTDGDTPHRAPRVGIAHVQRALACGVLGGRRVAAAGRPQHGRVRVFAATSAPSLVEVVLQVTHHRPRLSLVCAQRDADGVLPSPGVGIREHQHKCSGGQQRSHDCLVVVGEARRFWRLPIPSVVLGRGAVDSSRQPISQEGQNPASRQTHHCRLHQALPRGRNSRGLGLRPRGTRVGRPLHDGVLVAHRPHPTGCVVQR